ncbi:hypothetical protein EDD18DRAFT_1328989 [Armillaria luteobubalina]|uniref:Heterokaryon incompatibility domain-containing protein n=1 Tax=Armillaria luteobubalina TaxID=153913 RepID=A0AA39QF75_9AGAR|nr:hypothetical protein EDD18DRAFT_1328989 [Armillaria luteobubalina]
MSDYNNIPISGNVPKRYLRVDLSPSVVNDLLDPFLPGIFEPIERNSGGRSWGALEPYNEIAYLGLPWMEELKVGMQDYQSYVPIFSVGDGGITRADICDVRNQIVKPRLPPRRVWDLYSNRVVPWWLTPIELRLPYAQDRCRYGEDHEQPVPISHAWVDEKDRTAVWTPINGKEWPVPIPRDADLNLIRIEMLNLGADYAWLDVLCLRQEGGPREDLRTEEWRLDVPTIGAVYDLRGRRCVDSPVVCYLSGLGRPLTLKEGDLDSDRSWFRRAWTLQEVGYKRVITGDTPDGPLHAECTEDGVYKTELLTKFHKQSTRYPCRMSDLLLEMRTRVSTKPMDKIAGLAFLMWSRWIPAYYESASLEDAWTALVHSMHDWLRMELFLLCPEPGDGDPKWRPSWEQAMTKPLLPYRNDRGINRDETRNEDWCECKCTDGFVRGLAVVEGGDRHGKFIVKRCNGSREKRFEITAAHTYPIPEDTYTLIYVICYGEDRNESVLHACVIGRSLPGGRFEKVSVLETSDTDLRRITKQRRCILI